MTTDIFIKTCNRDQFYHVFCIQSINRFCSGFNKTVVVCSEHPRGYLEQQVVKLHADLHCDADFILVTDSDTLFTEPVTPESFMRDGKPIWFHTPWTKELIEAVPWHPVMERFFVGEQPHSEMMRRQPFMFPREVLKCFRDFCEVRHGVSIGEYIHQKGIFSEWNALGAYCWLYHHEKFAWVNTNEECPQPLVRQFWSHDPLETNIQEIKSILK